MSRWEIKGKRILVTGGTNGIGQATALQLAQMGAEVSIVSRERARCEATGSLARTRTGHDIKCYTADLSSQEQVRRFASEFLAENDRLDVLINNAGGIFFRRMESAEGYEYTFALNHLGYFLLTDLLLDLVKRSAPARIINVSSFAYVLGKINFTDIQTRYKYTGMKAYSQSKLANILFTRELAARLNGTGVTCNCLHPGMVDTGFGLERGEKRPRLSFFGLFGTSPEKGARTSVYLAASPEVSGVTGGYFVRCKSKWLLSKARDDTIQKRLWEISESLTKPRI